MDAFRDAGGAWKPPQNVDPKAVARALAAALGVIVVVVLLFSSYYTVAPEEKAVVLRFGKHVSTADPGLHFKLPFGIDTAVKVPVTEVRKLEFGFGTQKTGIRTTYRPESDEDRAVKLMLTGDLNIVSVSWVVQYQIANPEEYLFQVRDPDRAIRDLSESAMRAVVGDHTIDEVLRNRESVAALMQKRLSKSLDDYKAGVRVVTVQLQNVTPPPKVSDSFNEVNKAQQERSQLENEAMQEYNRVIPLASGEGRQRIAESEGYAIDRTNRAQGEIAKFTELLAEYKRSRVVTRKRLYLETLEEVLPKVKRIVVASEGGVLKLLPLEGQGGVR